MATAQDVSTTISEIELIAKEILGTVTALDPAITVPVTVAEALAELVAKALSAWSAASGTPITADSVLALLPDPTPLTPPTIQ